MKPACPPPAVLCRPSRGCPPRIPLRRYPTPSCVVCPAPATGVPHRASLGGKPLGHCRGAPGGPHKPWARRHRWRGLCSILAAEHPPAVLPAHCPGGRNRSRLCGDPTGARGPALYGRGLHRAGGGLLAAGGPMGTSVRLCAETYGSE